jgi:hypothetical protein
MNPWLWLNANSGAIQSVLALVTIVVLAFTWWAIKIQADAARALKRVAIEQTEAIREQAEAALQSVAVTDAANRIAEKAVGLSVEQKMADLRPILIFEITLNQAIHITQNAIRNVGRGPATDVQISIGRAKDQMPKSYIPCRTLIGSGDQVSFAINREEFIRSGMTIYYSSLDGRRFASSIYVYEGSIKHDFEELKP